MKYLCLLMLALAAPATAAPVHISLKTTVGASTSSGGFLTLAQIADLSGGTQAERLRMASVPVGRSPLPGDTRLLTPGDVTLKLRQAGFHPERDAILEGAKQVAVVGADTPAAAPQTLIPEAIVSVPTLSVSPAPALTEKPVPSAPVIHSNDMVAIVVQEGDLCITTKGVARQSGAVGQTIRVHRDGALSDLAAIVVNAQTVQLEP